MPSNPVSSKPFTAACQEVTGAALGREGARCGGNMDRGGNRVHNKQNVTTNTGMCSFQILT